MEICQFQALVDPFEGKRSRLLFESANCKVLHLIAGYQLRCSASYFNGIIVFVINDIERKSCYCIAHRDNQRIVFGRILTYVSKDITLVILCHIIMACIEL